MDRVRRSDSLIHGRRQGCILIQKRYGELDRLSKTIQAAGYMPETCFVVHDVE